MKTSEQVVPNNVDEVKLVYHSRTPANQRLKICSSADANRVLLDTWDEGTLEHHETFKILLLNRANRLLGIVVISNGGIAGTVIDIRQIFQAAVKSNCSSIIAAHNHPSGNKQPSEADVQITRKISEAGKIMDIKLLDHIIIAPGEGYFSFADEGLL